MLQKLRAQSRSFFIWFLFAIIIVSFIVTFGPASMQLTCGRATDAGEIGGRTLSNADYRFAMVLGMGRRSVPERKAVVLDLLLRRELLVREAERMGIRVEEKEISDMITKRRSFYVLGLLGDLFNYGAWPHVVGDDGQRKAAPHYYHPQFKRWVKYYLRMKPHEFIDQQKKELMAQNAEFAIRSGVIVSEAEARAIFEYKNHSLELQFAKFDIDAFKKRIVIFRPEITRWLSDKKNRDQVDERYKKNKWRLTGLAHERRVRHILIKVPKDADAKQKAEAKARMDQLAKNLAPAPLEFARSAQVYSEDEKTRDGGGDLGWVEKGKLGFGKKVAEEVFKIKPMTVSAVLTSDQGFHLFYVEGDRKGDVSKAKARVWLAEEILVDGRAKAFAMKTAREGLRRLLMGGKMEAVFPPPPDKTKTDDKSDEGVTDDKDKPKPKLTPKPGDQPKVTPKPTPAPTPKRWHPLLPQPEKVSILRTESIIAPIGNVKGLVAKVWALSEEDPVLPEVVTVPGSGKSLGYLVVIRLERKTQPDMKEFDKQKRDHIDDLRRIKGDDAVARFVYSKCEALRAKGEIKLRKEVSKILVYSTGSGSASKKPREIPYIPCARLPRFGQRPFTF